MTDIDVAPEKSPEQTSDKSSEITPAEIDLTDGRRTRRIRNKVAVIDAYLDLVGEGNDSPSVGEVAERSRVSHRSVFRYFSDKEDLARSSIDRQIERLGPLLTLQIDNDAPLDDRIEHLLIRRFELFEQIAPIARLMRSLASNHNSLGDLLSRNRYSARRQIAKLFELELSAMSDTRAEEALAVIDVLCSFESGELFRWDLKLPMDRSVAAIAPVLSALLDQPALSAR
ncbi:MAG: TetR/AcrR family transcriptional regulator [Ilumatobacteraceae bacterium]